MSSGEENSSSYSPLLGTVYIFNLIVGTGALALPQAFGASGYVLASITLTLLCFISLITSSYVLEAMSIANALRRAHLYDDVNVINQDHHRCQENDDQEDLISESRPLLRCRATSDVLAIGTSPETGLYDIVIKMELGDMATMFFNRAGKIGFYFALCIYLYGDLAIYAAAIPKSLRDAVCTLPVSNFSAGAAELAGCWPEHGLTRMDVYRLFLGVFGLLITPCVFFELRKTLLLQIVTSVLRWLAFALMLAYASLRLVRPTSTEELGRPPIVADLASLPNLFGVSVYAFMCHHSLPNLVTPLRNKHRILRLLSGTYLLILSFYLALACTGAAAFRRLEDFYTLNFGPAQGNGIPLPIAYFLILFPVFTLSASFPIIALTLCNNLVAMASEFVQVPQRVRRLVFPLLTALPPLLIACVTNDLTQLVGITGGYGGLLVQYVIPTALVWAARRERDRVIPTLLQPGVKAEAYTRSICPQASHLRQWHRTVFAGRLGLLAVLGWSLMTVVFLTLDKFFTSAATPIANSTLAAVHAT